MAFLTTVKRWIVLVASTRPYREAGSTPTPSQPHRISSCQCPSGDKLSLNMPNEPRHGFWNVGREGNVADKMDEAFYHRVGPEEDRVVL